MYVASQNHSFHKILWAAMRVTYWLSSCELWWWQPGSRAGLHQRLPPLLHPQSLEVLKWWRGVLWDLYDVINQDQILTIRTCVEKLNCELKMSMWLTVHSQTLLQMARTICGSISCLNNELHVSSQEWKLMLSHTQCKAHIADGRFNKTIYK